MKKYFPLFLLICNFFFAQNQRFSYEYQFVKDTLNKQEITKELMNLDITNEGSSFYSHDTHVSDSTMNTYFEKQIKTSGSMNVDMKMMSQRKGSVRYKIFKKYPDFKIAASIKMGMDSYQVSDDRKMVWTILPDQQKIGEFNAQKATTDFAGRKWVAWFSHELPFQDGPYKFHGLPGLIVKLEDLTKTHQFELVGISKFTPVAEKISEFGVKKKDIEISQKQYRKIYSEDRNDPAKVIKQALANGAVFQLTDQNGNNISTAEMIKNKEQGAKAKNAKDNNIIELDLLK
ncbi:GLPGLI family protein [Chryseobacterium gotjawalense]|uniref:GLPGLI family protein n=1 Tax=Chryseobacterium gotjawalense TaxID=3042315 RepID=A0ABY8RG76_9FLAO|nr:GLPGLI family protein [Chryseobacterium sp. wdc7]WHF52227.1 GLPGLI family protein [Chryseobacterium sp. wdc7]